jgi:lactam utilization protein B
VLPCPIDSVCVHGDGLQAVALARAVALGLRAQGVRLAGLTAA